MMMERAGQDKTRGLKVEEGVGRISRGARTTCSIGGDGDQEDFKSYRSLEEELNIFRNLMCMLIPVRRSPSPAMIPAGADM
ncbi:unnamed protein product [Sphagnum balticum]